MKKNTIATKLILIMITVVGCNTLEKDYDLEKIVNYLQPHGVTKYLNTKYESGDIFKYVGIKLDDCRNVGENKVDPNIAASYACLLI